MPVERQGVGWEKRRKRKRRGTIKGDMERDMDRGCGAESSSDGGRRAQGGVDVVSNGMTEGGWGVIGWLLVGGED